MNGQHIDADTAERGKIAGTLDCCSMQFLHGSFFLARLRDVVDLSKNDPAVMSRDKISESLRILEDQLARWSDEASRLAAAFCAQPGVSKH